MADGRLTEMHDLAKRCDDIAAANGFDPPAWENLPAKVMMVVTELDEAVDAALGCGDDPLHEELADAAIRMLSLLHGIWDDDWIARPVKPPRTAAAFRTIETQLWAVLGRLCKSVEAWRKDHRGDARGQLEFALAECFSVAEALRIDLVAQIEAKCAKNSARPKLHGKIRSVG